MWAARAAADFTNDSNRPDLEYGNSNFDVRNRFLREGGLSETDRR